MWSRALLLLAASAIACGLPEKTAAKPPAVLRDLAGPDAIDCGVGRSAASDAAVSDCGTSAIAVGRPFFCSYENWSLPVGNVIAPRPDDAGGYAYSPAGTLYVQAGDSAPLPVWERSRGALRPMEMNRTITPPGIEELSGTKLPSIDVLKDRVFVLMTVTDGGVVVKPRVMARGLPIEVVWEIQDALRGKRCSPATVFGQPISVEYGAAFTVSDGELRV